MTDFNAEPVPDPQPVVIPAIAPGAKGQARTIAIAELILCSSVPTQIFLQGVLLAFGWQARTPDGGLSLSFVVTVSLADTVLLIALMVLLTRAHGESLSELWLGHRRPWKEVVLGVALILPVFLLVALLLVTIRVFAPGFHNVATNPLEELAHGGLANALLFGLVAIFAGGVREELQRAFLLRRFEQHLGGARVGIIVLSVAFGLGHALQGWDAAIATGTLGAFWAIVYVRRRSSLAPLVSHAGFNSLEVIRVAMAGS